VGSYRGWALGAGLLAAIGCGDDREPDHVFPGDYERLGETDLFRDLAARELAPDLIRFEPSYALWSDGSDKERYLRLPPGAAIDTADMDHWQLPVGAQLFKSFTSGGVLVETRLIERIAETGDRDQDYWVGAFVWRDDESDADAAPDGAANARRTDHDVPDTRTCWLCHRGQPGAALGLSALQLSSGELEALTDRLSHPPSGAYAVPGGPAVQAALGYLHANCSQCHNPRGAAWIDTDMDLELSVLDLVAEDTRTYRSTVGVELQYFTSDDHVYRVVAGDPSASGLLHRMTIRGSDVAMPPVGSELVHEAGIDLVSDWIGGL
jgi:hypothetical protein